jgi:hypothetical protein
MGGGGGKGGAMTQSLYAHLNKGNFKKERKNEKEQEDQCGWAGTARMTSGWFRLPRNGL